jgi:hypothetical protein
MYGEVENIFLEKTIGFQEFSVFNGTGTFITALTRPVVELHLGALHSSSYLLNLFC